MAQDYDPWIDNQRLQQRLAYVMDELERLRKIEAMALACDGIDMGRHYEVPTQAWEDLMAAVWEGQEALTEAK